MICGFISDKLGDRLLIRTGIIIELIGIAVMPAYLLIFAVLNIGFLEIAYRRADANMGRS